MESFVFSKHLMKTHMDFLANPIVSLVSIPYSIRNSPV